VSGSRPLNEQRSNVISLAPIIVAISELASAVVKPMPEI